MRFRLGLLVVLVTTIASETQSFAANQDGVPLSPDAMIGGITLNGHDGPTGAWYNPAALGGIGRSSIQLSSSIYTLGFRNIDGLVETRLPWETRRDPLSSSDFTTIPSGISFIFRIGERFGLSFGLFSPVREYYSFDSQTTSVSPDQTITFTQSMALTQRIDSTQGVVGFGWAVTDRFRLGASVSVTQDSLEEVFDFSMSVRSTAIPTPGFLGSIQRTTSSQFGFRGTLGMQWEAARWLSLSLAARSPVAGFAASGKTTVTAYSNNAYEQRSIDAQPLAMGAPARLFWGAQTTFGRLRLALEGDVRHPIDNSTCGDPNEARCTAGADKWVVNGRLGGIVQATDHIWIGLGGFTDMGGRDLLKSGNAIDFFGGTAGVQFRSPSVIKLRGGADPWDLRTTIGFRYAIGIGQTGSELVDLATPNLPNEQRFRLNPVPSNNTFHELSVNIATGLEF